MSDEMEEYRKQLNELVVWCVDTRDIVPPTAQQMRYERVVRLCEKLIATLASKGGTSHCTLAASEIDRHLAEIDRLKRQIFDLRNPWCLTSPRYKNLMSRYMPGVFHAIEALAAADKIAKGEQA